MPRLPRLGWDDAVRLLGTGAGVDVSDLARARRRLPPRPPSAPVAVLDGAARVLGLDLAMGCTGWCLLDRGRPAAHGVFGLPDRRRNEPLADWLGRRAVVLGEQVGLIVRLNRPELVAFEYPDTYRRAWSGGSKGREFEVSQALGRVQGFLVALWPQIADGVRLEAVSTSDAKRAATGRVDANKDQVRQGLRYLGWDVTGWTDDESDAAAVALAAREGMA